MLSSCNPKKIWRQWVALKNNWSDADKSPRRIKILFLGWPESSHTHSWIDLVQDTEFDVRLFAMPPSLPPHEWKVKTYLTPFAWFTLGLDNKTRRTVYPRGNIVAPFIRLWEKTAGRLGWFPFVYRILFSASRHVQSDMINKSLAHVVESWRPDIVHTLGFDPASFLFATAQKYMKTGKRPLWIAQVRGGPDLVLNRHLPGYAEKIREVLETCDQFIADNSENYSLAPQMGLQPGKASSLGVVPGTGGIDVTRLSKAWNGPPSRRLRIIMWPKAYDAPSSKALPVLEALRLAWQDIEPCQIHLFWVIQPEIRMWIQILPEEIRNSCIVHERMPRDFVLSLMTKARVMLAPSLADGIPNAMMEAMASGAFPIVSPLDTITPVVKNETNVLFARNLYPQEIAGAISRAMNDDTLVDDAAVRNLDLVKRIADRESIRIRVNDYYRALTSAL